jgi:pimeloyl-ACP methyl ester carboxylesterase
MGQKSGFVDSNGTLIYYQVRGEGTPLVLLMGFGADGNLWEQHVAEYQKHFRCIMLDNRGVGKSDAPKGPYNTAMMADDTVAVMDHLETEAAQVAGISMGGAIAQSLALNHPDRVKSLVLISTWPSFNNYARTVYENLKKIRTRVSTDDFMELLQLWIFAPPYYENHLEDLKAAQVGALNNPSPQTKDGFEGQLDACINHDVVSKLHQIRIRVLITIGMMDIFTPPAFSDLLHAKIQGSQLVRFPMGGHVHHWEDLERFNRVTTKFLLENQ